MNNNVLERWTSEMVSGVWRIYASPIIREDNEITRGLTEEQARAIVDAHNVSMSAMLKQIPRNPADFMGRGGSV